MSLFQTRTADILVVGVGKPSLVTGDMVKPGAVVIDCGINYDEEKDGKRKLGNLRCVKMI